MILKIKHLSIVASILLIYVGCGDDSATKISTIEKTNKTLNNKQTNINQNISVPDKILMKIQHYANDNHNPEPTVIDYENLDITGVDSTNIDEINNLIIYSEKDDLKNPSDIQDIVDKLRNSKSKPFNDDSEKKSKQDRTDEITNDNLKIIQRYSTSSNSVPTLDIYSNIGIYGVNIYNLEKINQFIRNATITEKQTVEDIQQIVNSVIDDSNKNVDDNRSSKIIDKGGNKTGKSKKTIENSLEVALNKFKNISKLGNTVKLTLSDYSDLGVNGVNSENIDAINEAIIKSDKIAINTIYNVQNTIDNIKIKLNSFERIKLYLVNQSNDVPTIADYFNVGINGEHEVTDNYLFTVNRKIAKSYESQIRTINKLRYRVGLIVNKIDLALEKMRNYSESHNNDEPTRRDYLDLEISGITAENIHRANRLLTRDNTRNIQTIQNIVSGDTDTVGRALLTIQNYSFQNRSKDKRTPTQLDYKSLLIDNITEDNLRLINKAIKATKIDDLSSKKKIQDIVIKIIGNASTAIRKIQESVTNNTIVLTVENYKNAGISGINSFNLYAVNRIISRKRSIDVSDIYKIQLLVNKGIKKSIDAFEIIKLFADFSNQLVPTTLTYLQAGIIGVNDANLYSINKEIKKLRGREISTIELLQRNVSKFTSNSNDAFTKIQNYTTPTGEKPTFNDYLNAGVVGINSSMLYLLNKKVREKAKEQLGSVGEVQKFVRDILRIQMRVFSKFKNYSTNTNITIEDYRSIGIDSINSNILTIMNKIIKDIDTSHINILAELQLIINNKIEIIISIVQKIHNYAINHNNQKPTIDDYATLKLTEVDDNNINAINLLIDIRKVEYGDGSMDKIETIIHTTKVRVDNILMKIQNYISDNQQRPTLEDYKKLAILNIAKYNLNVVNKLIHNSKINEINSVSKLQVIVNVGAQLSTQSFEKIKNYAKRISMNRPTIEDYFNAGIEGVNNKSDLSLINSKLDKYKLTRDDIQNILTNMDEILDKILFKIKNYANDNSNPKPTLDNYLKISMKNINRHTLYLVNSLVDKTNQDGVNTLTKVQILINQAHATYLKTLDIIRRYPNNSSINIVPIVDDYLNIGIADVNQQNLYIINQDISNANLFMIDTIEKIENLVNKSIIKSQKSFLIIQEFIQHTSDTEPTIEDFINAGFISVNNTNIYSIIQLFKNYDIYIYSFVSIKGVVNAGKGLARNALNRIKEYINENKSAPTYFDYIKLGIVGVNSKNIYSVNKLIFDDESLLNSKNLFNDIEKNIRYALYESKNAANIIKIYLASNKSPSVIHPNTSDYLYAGANLVRNTVNSIQMNTMAAQIEDDKLDILGILKSDPNSITVKKLNDIPGVSKALEKNEDAYIEAIKDNLINISDIATVEEINKLIDYVNKQEFYINYISQYADDNTNNAPTLEEYKKAGIIGVTAYNIMYINEVLKDKRNEAYTKKLIQLVVNSVIVPSSLPNNLTILKNDLEFVVGSVSNNLTKLVTNKAYTVLIPYSATEDVMISAYNYTRDIMVDATSNEEKNLKISFSWEAQKLLKGDKMVLKAKLIIKDGSIKDGYYIAKPLDLNSNFEGIVASEIPYPLNNVRGNTGMFKLIILPGIKDRNYDKLDNNENKTHNFVYMPIRNRITGRTWLNNNLGAAYSSVNMASQYGNSCKFNLTNQAKSQLDQCAYGSKFQWGRKADGHELMNYSDSNTKRLYNETTTINDTNNPNHTKFIINRTLWNNWTNSKVKDQWANYDTENNPCPVGYVVPSLDEWIEELNSSLVSSKNSYRDFVANKSALHLPIVNSISGQTGIYESDEQHYGLYWTRTTNRSGIVDYQNGNKNKPGGYDRNGNWYDQNINLSKRVFITFRDSNSSIFGFEGTMTGMAIRCIKEDIK